MNENFQNNSSTGLEGGPVGTGAPAAQNNTVDYAPDAYSTQQPVYQQPAYQQPAYQQPAYQQPVNTPDYNNFPVVDEPEPPAKKKKTGLLIGIIAAVVVLLAGAAVCVFLFLCNDCKKAFSTFIF